MAADLNDPNTFVGPTQDQASMDPSTLRQILALLAGTGVGVAGRLMAPDINSQVPPELRQQIALQNERMAYQNPLYEAVTNQALQGLPTYAKQGKSLAGSLGGVPGVSGGLSAAPSNSGSGAMSTLGTISALLPLIQALAKKAATSSLPPIASGGGPSGDQPTHPEPAIVRDTNRFSDPSMAYLVGNPNARAIDPVIGPVFGGSDQGGAGRFGGHGGR